MGNISNYRLNSTVFLFTILMLSSGAGTAQTTTGAENRPGIQTAADASEYIGKINVQDEKQAEHKKAIEACKAEVQKTDLQCAASQNTNSQNAQQTMSNTQQTNTADTTGATGQASQCGGMGDMAKLAQPMVQAYKSECDTARKACKSSCKQQQQASETACVSIQDPIKKQLCQANANIAKSYADKVDTSCASYKQNSDQAGQLISALAGMLLSMMACQQDLGIEDPALAQEMERQCTLTADPSVCTRSDTAGLNDLAKKMAADSPSTGSPTLDDGVDGQRSKNQGGGAPTPPYAPGGGGTSAGGRQNAAKEDTPAGAPAKKEVYEGDLGGGGRGMASVGGGYPDAPESMAAALKNAQVRRDSVLNQFTGGQGRSNWQKVRERYRDNSPTLDAISTK